MVKVFLWKLHGVMCLQPGFSFFLVLGFSTVSSKPRYIS
ncbi:ZNF708 isoform 1 [Pongo abelii]|uniref:ZNF708 isoform 1 n=1 Tax=Pongo abelii TaxID=9601 RepID=A0A2J8RFP7_PONAB|nr:ZNF708 isoform 1 [Pongo abelii]